MKTGTWEIKEIEVENGREVAYTKVIKIREENFYGTPSLYQTETCYRNSVQTFSANYPATSEYARERRVKACLNF